jgi:hypothetical protein
VAGINQNCVNTAKKTTAWLELFDSTAASHYKSIRWLNPPTAEAGNLQHL